MHCPTCEKEFYPQPDKLGVYFTNRDKNSKDAVRFSIQQCPSCCETLIIKEKGQAYKISNAIMFSDIESESVIYPQSSEFTIPQEVPKQFSDDILEAHEALNYSAKASAALSRRLLQKTLREVLGITKRDLSQEIETFINTANAPTYLTDAIDAVRQIGNFAAHPIKNANTGEIVEVEPGEAEWLLEVLESLFDFVFVQPAKLEQRRESLNKKLRELGKSELKSS